MDDTEFVVESDVYRLFGFWSGVLVLKLIIMVPLTIWQRFTKKVVANPNDTILLRNAEAVYDDPDVECVRRAHHNDLENILPWFIVTFLWLQTNPSEMLAGILIRTFVVARLVHTLVYAVYSQQPLRAISFSIGLSVIIFETVSILIYYF